MTTQKPGMEPYSPSRLEWVVLQLKLGFGDYDINEGGFGLYFGHNNDDTIIIEVLHTKNVDRQEMNSAIELAREYVETTFKKMMKWDWLKIEERYNT